MMEMLQVKNGRVVDGSGRPVRLRGTCVGGWMNMENFIDGYPAAEHSARAALAEVLGPAKAQFFFDRLLDHFLADDDLAFIRRCGANVVRLPLNYRHFESDVEPFRYLEAGFARLDRMVEACGRQGLYVILDLHAVQGWQNTDWHCDNANRISLFWRMPHFQDRFVALWEEMARRYRGNATVAGYNVMNEPVTNTPDGRFGSQYTPDWAVINAVYRRVVEAIRAIDPEHIIFLEGDYYSNRFAGLEAPFADNLVYSSHNYSACGFGPGSYPSNAPGKPWDRAGQREAFLTHEGPQYARKHNVPLWVGEFGAVYNGPAEEVPDRLRALDDQIDVFEEWGAHWTTWTYKDVGVMGWVTLDPESDYMQAIADSQRVKRELGTDAWTTWLPVSRAGLIVRELARCIEEVANDPEIDPASNRRHLADAALACYAASLVAPLWARQFRGMSEERIDAMLQSFAFKNCRVNQGLVEVIGKHTARPA